MKWSKHFVVLRYVLSNPVGGANKLLEVPGCLGFLQEYQFVDTTGARVIPPVVAIRPRHLGFLCDKLHLAAPIVKFHSSRTPKKLLHYFYALYESSGAGEPVVLSKKKVLNIYLKAAEAPTGNCMPELIAP